MQPCLGTPESFGWLRIPHEDILNGECWELPNGQRRFIPRGQAFCVVRDHIGVISIKLMTTKAKGTK